MRNRYRGKHVDRTGSMKKGIRDVSGRVGKSFLALALACLLFPASSLAVSVVSGDEDRFAEGQVSDVILAQVGAPEGSEVEGIEGTSDGEASGAVVDLDGESPEGGAASPSSAAQPSSTGSGTGTSAGILSDDDEGDEGDDSGGDDPDDPEPQAPLSVDDITIMAKSGEYELSPYSATDSTMYSVGAVELTVSVSNLEAGDVIEIDGTGDYADWVTSSKTVSAEDGAVFSESIAIGAAGDKANIGKVTVTVSRGADPVDSVSKEFANGITVDTTPPKVSDFMFDADFVASEYDADGGASTKFFNLDGSATSSLAKLKLSATLTEANLASKELKIEGLDSAKSSVDTSGAWDDSDAGDGVYRLAVEFEATNFVGAAANATLAAQAYIQATDKAGRTLNDANKVYPTATDANAADDPNKSVAFTANDYFSAENALLDGVTASMSFENADPVTKSGDAKLYFKDTVMLSGITFGNAANSRLKTTDVAPADYVLSVDGSTIDVGGTFSDNALSATGAGFAAEADAVKTYAGTTIKVTSEHGATRVLPLDVVVVDNTKPVITATLNTEDAASRRTVNEDVQWLYKDATAPAIMVTVENTSSLTGKGDVVVTTTDGTTASTVSGSDITWASDMDDGTWIGTVTMSTAPGASPAFENNKAYAVESVTARTIFDGTDDLPASADVETDPILFMADTTLPVITIALTNAHVTDPDRDGSPIVVAIIDSVNKSVGKITITVEDNTFDKDDEKSSTVKLGGTDLAPSWTSAGGDKYTFDIPYSSDALKEGNGWTLDVTAKDLVGHEISYSYASADESNSTTVNDNAFTAEEGNRYFNVDTKSVKFEGFKLYADEECTTEAVCTTKDDIDYYDYAAVYGVLEVSDANFSKGLSTITVYKGDTPDATLSGGDWMEVEGERDGDIRRYRAVHKFESGTEYHLALTASDTTGNTPLLTMDENKDQKVTDNRFTVSNLFPSITVKMNQPVLGTDAAEASTAGESATTDWFGNTVTATVTVTGTNLITSGDGAPVVKPTTSTNRDLSGLASTDWNPVSGGLAATVTFTDNAFDANAVEMYGIEVSASDLVGHLTTYVYGDNAKVQDAPDGGERSTLTNVSDSSSAGEKTESAGFIVDSVAPSVAIATETPRANQATTTIGGAAAVTDYYAANVAATITVTDAHFDKDRAAVSDEAGNALDLVSAWSPEGAGAWKASVAFGDNAAGTFHTLKVVAPDAAAALGAGTDYGHATTCQYGDNAEGGSGPSGTTAAAGARSTKAGGVEVDGARFVVDSVAPDMTIVLDQPVANVDADTAIDYYTAKTTATVTVKDANFDPTSSRVTTAEGIVVDEASDNGWVQEESDAGVFKAQVVYEDTPIGKAVGLSVVAQDYVYRVGDAMVDTSAHQVEYSYGGAEVSGNTSGGNVSTRASDGDEEVSGTSFVIDTKAPEVTVTIDPTSKKSVTVSGVTTDYYDQEVTATITATDANFDAANSTVSYRDASGIDHEITPGASGWKPVDSSVGTYEYELAFEFENDFGKTYAFSADARDKAMGDDTTGHNTKKSYADAQGAGSSFVVDLTDPMVDVVIDQALVGTATNAGGGLSAAASTDYYASVSGDSVLTATITVTDNTFDTNTEIIPTNGAVVTTASGATWTQTDTSKPVWTATVRFSETEVDKTCDLGTIEAGDKSGRVTEYRYGYNESIGKSFWKNTSTIAGTGESAKVVTGDNFIIDVTKPTIEVAFKSVDADPLSPDWTDSEAKIDYYASAPVAHVTVRDRNFDSDVAKSAISAPGTSDESALEWTQDVADHEVWTAVIPFGENQGTVDAVQSRLEVLALDKVNTLAPEDPTAADHRAEWAYADGVNDPTPTGAESFITDLTDPVVTISVDQSVKGTNGAKDYYDADVTATISVTDRHFAQDGNAQLGTSVVKDGAALTMGDWSQGAQSVDGNVTWTNTVLFDAEGEHELSMVIVDKTRANSVSKVYRDASAKGSASFIVDKTDPAIAISVNQPKQDTDESGVDYFDAALTATVTVVDANFKAEDTEVYVNDQAYSSARWSRAQDDDAWQTTVNYIEGNGHRLSVKAGDWAARSTQSAYGDEPGKGGNDSILGSTDSEGVQLVGSAFTIDETKPVVSYRMNQEKVATHLDVDYFSNIKTGDEQAIITVTVEDVNFNPGSTLNVVTKNGIVQKRVTWTNVRSTYWTTEVAYNEGAGNTLDVTVSDWAKNKRSLVYGRSTTDDADGSLSSSEFAVDLTAPKVESVETNKDFSGNYDNEFYFWDKKTILAINVTDNIGLRSVSLVDTDKFYNKENYVVKDAKKGKTKDKVVIAFADGQEFDRAITLETVDLAYNTRIWSIAPNGDVVDATGSSRKNTSAVDDAHPKGMIQDTVNPQLAFSGVSVGAYYNTTQTVVLDVNELNFRYLKLHDASQGVVTVNKVVGDASAAESSWVVPVRDFDEVTDGQNPAGLDGLYRCTEDFSGDGHYTLSATLTDPAGNAVTVRQGEFTIDKTPPTVRVEFDNNDAANGSYYAAGRTATITLTEHNFDPGLINISTSGTVGSWESDGDIHVIMVSFNTDGDHTLSVSGGDRAGNELEAYTAPDFTVDTEAPSVTISFIGGSDENQRAFNDVIRPVITFTDGANFDSDGKEFTLRGNKVGDISLDNARYGYSTDTDANGETVTYLDFEHVIEVDDIYTLTARLTDMAGNESEEAIETFSVNRFGSNYIIMSPDQENGGSPDLGYLDTAPEIVVQEINVTGIEESSVAVTYNLKTTNLERQSVGGQAGYTVQDLSSRANYGWQEYEYTIARESFVGEAGGNSPDGNYMVVLSSKDTSGNTNSSANFWVEKADDRKSVGSDEEDTDTEKRMSAAVKFTLDTTPPDLFGLSVENGETVVASGEKEVSFIATDNLGLDEDKGIAVLVDHDPVAHTVSNDGSGRVTFNVPERPFVNQPIEISVVDFATNKRSIGVVGDGDEAFEIKVTNDPVDLYLPLIIGGVVAAVVVAGAVGYGVMRHRRGTGAAQAKGE